MTTKLFLDIETIPPTKAAGERLRLENALKVLSNGLKAEVLKYRAKKQANGTSASVIDLPDEAFRRLSLTAEYGTILCIGVILEREGEILKRGVFGFDQATAKFHLDEAKTLRGFWKLIKNFNVERDLVVGHNVMEFDLPYIIKRSRIVGVAPSINLSFARYRSAPIYDTMREWSLWSNRDCFLSLAHLAELLNVGIGKSNGIDGSRVYDEFLLGNHQKIADYCLQDVEVARAVYYRMVLPEQTFCQ